MDGLLDETDIADGGDVVVSRKADEKGIACRVDGRAPYGESQIQMGNVLSAEAILSIGNVEGDEERGGTSGSCD